MDDSRVDATMLRRALEDVRAVGALTPPNSETVKIEYLSQHKELMTNEAFEQTVSSIRSSSPPSRSTIFRAGSRLTSG